MLELVITVVSALVSRVTTKTTAVHPTRVLDMEAIGVQVLATQGKQDSDTSLLVRLNI